MQVTQAQITSGAANFLRSEIIPKIPDKGFRVVLETAAAMVEMSPRIVDQVFRSPMVALLIQGQDGLYDLEHLEAALTKAMETHGGLTVTVPAIPLVSPTEKSMTFAAADIKSLMRYITG